MYNDSSSYVPCLYYIRCFMCSLTEHYMQYNTGVDVSWQETEMMIPEGNDGDMTQANLCITLEDRNGGLQREARFLLTTVPETAGELM